ncbi:ABC transporter substrate-binding protein [uncultured Paraglaciecola sp.]|uniref:substrate-binding periplasmic protein n=1 Tax=uncultured Paraglaciecola sp. TaxID=1765024 RepID=UPI0030DA8B24
MFFCSVTLLLVIFSNSSAANTLELTLDKLPQVTFYTESYPPANFMKDNKLAGISIDSLKLMWADLGLPEQNVLMVPWARGYRNVLKTPNTALFTMSRTPAREKLFKWVGPLFKSVHVLMAKKSANLKFENLADVLSYKVATIQGDVSEISLLEIGFPDFNLAKVTDLERAFLMMQKGRVDMIMVSIHGFQHLTKLLKADPAEYEQVWQVNEIGNYIAFNLDTPDFVIQGYQQAFENVAEQRRLIKEKYALPKIEY